MVKEHSLGLMEKSILGSSRMGNFMVKGHTLGLMDKSMKENLRMGKNGMVQYMTMTELRNRSM